MAKKIDMIGKICMITGSNSGIGKATALGLAEMGATIIMVCRKKERGESAMKEIVEKTGNSSIDLFITDLASQIAIRDLVNDFKNKYKNLHVLINNAGIVLHKRKLTVDGIEANFAVNYLAPFLLSNLLIDVLNVSAPARIINIVSGLHASASLDFNDLQNEKKYRAFPAYNKSKLALVLFTYELAKRINDTGVTVNCIHPGVVRTNLGHDLPLYYRWATVFFRPPEKGAETPIYLASSYEVEGISGKYFKNKKQIESSKESYDESIAERLWDESVKLTNLDA